MGTNATPQASAERPVRVAVACTGASGEPELPIFTVHVTDHQHDLGEHYDLAQQAAADEGYEGPFVCFDDQEFAPILRTAAELAPAKKPSIVVQLDGGVVLGVVADVPVNVMAADYDTEDCDEFDLAELPLLPTLDTDGDTRAHAGFSTCDVRVSAEATRSLVRAGRGDSAAASPGDAAQPAPATFTVFVQQADGRGTVYIGSYKAATSEEAAAAALEQVAEDWGSDDEPWDKDDLRILGIAKGDIDILEWNDLDD